MAFPYAIIRNFPQMPSQTIWNKEKCDSEARFGKKNKKWPILTIIYFIRHRLGWHRGGWFGFREMMCWPDAGGREIERDSPGRWRPCSAADMTHAHIKLSGLWTAAIGLLTRCTLNSTAPGLQEDACLMETICLMDGVSWRYILICYFLLYMTETYLAAYKTP